MKSKVAIIMPYYNNDDCFFQYAIFSIIMQSFTDWHLYIIDDGSLDSKKPKINIAPFDLSKITIFTKTNGGASSARNYALEQIDASMHEYIAFCDADDHWRQDHLEQQIKCIQDSDMVFSEPILRFENGIHAYRCNILTVDEYPGIKALENGNFIYISSVLIKTSCMCDLRFDSLLDSIEDWDMWLSVAKKGYRLRKNNDKTITYFIREKGNASNGSLDKVRNCKIKHKIEV